MEQELKVHGLRPRRGSSDSGSSSVGLAPVSEGAPMDSVMDMRTRPTDVGGGCEYLSC